MRSSWLLASIVCVGSLAAPPIAGQAIGAGPYVYELSAPPSKFEWGCFGPCACPLYTQSEIVGTFVLGLSHADQLYTYYDVTDLRWKVQSPDGPVAITGSGTYLRGGEVALTEQLSLDLVFGEGPVQHFDSGMHAVGATFPEINTSVSLHGEWCFDSLLTVDAKPIGLASVDGRGGLSLAVGPNPFSGIAEAVFTMPGAGTVDLGVFDLAGRSVRALVRHELLPAGTHARAWDGKRDDGGTAPPGIYLVRLVTPTERVTRTAVRVR